MKKTHRRSLVAATLAMALVATGCASESTDDDDTTSESDEGDDTAEDSSADSGAESEGGDDADAAAGDALLVGTTDKVTSLDPAGSYDNGSFFVMNQVYGFLLNTAPGAEDQTPQPDLAESAEFTDPSTYTVTLKPGLKFANGNDLTSSDVKFSFDRQIAIADENGPSYLLGNIASVEAPDDTTVVFNLTNPDDQTFPYQLGGPAGPIVDEEVFPADAIMADDDIVAGHPFSGPYDINSYNLNELVSYTAYDGYQGMLGAAQTGRVDMKYYADASNMKLDITQGNIDIAYRSFSATDITDLQGNGDVNVVEGPGGEIRYIVFNFDTMPFGAKTEDADPAKAQAVRQAMADLIDRQALSDNIYKGTYSPLWSFVPDGFMGAGEPFKTTYGDGNGGPSVDAAKAKLEAAGITEPVTLNLQYNTDHYGPSSGDEYAAVKTQLENGGLFTVDLQSTEWVQYAEDRSADAYPMYQLGWFPDYSDPDNYLTPFFAEDNFLVNHYSNAEVSELLVAQATNPDAASREEQIRQIQDLVAADISTLPLLQGKQFAITGTDVSGLELDASFKMRLNTVTKG